MTWMTSLAVVATSLILAGPAAAQTPSSPTTPGVPPSTTPRMPGSTTPGMPGSTTPGTPGSTTPGLPGSNPGSPGLNNPSGTNPTFPCPPGQARRPGNPACVPGPGTPTPR
jgi:hypothetical protein